MAQLKETPIDELTNLPLPIFTSGPDFNEHAINFHHHFHPGRSTELGYTEEGEKRKKHDPERIEGYALRYSRGQDVPKWLHDRYHDIFKGPQLPQNTKDKFTLTVLACAGVVPREALDLHTPREWVKRALDNKQHEFIRRRIHYEGAGSLSATPKKREIGRFLADYVIQNSLDEVINESEVMTTVKNFLKPRSAQQRFEAGRQILTQAIDVSVAELVPLLEEAKNEGMVRHRARGLGQVVLKYFTIDRFPDYYEPLENRLSAYA